MFDLKVIHSVLEQMEDERGIPRERMIEAIEQALATAYKKEFGKRGQIIRADFDISTGDTTFSQIKIVVDENMVRMDDLVDESEEEEVSTRANEETEETPEGETKVRFEPEKHIMITDAKLIKKDVELGEELVFPLEAKEDFGRIAAQTAKQVIIQKIREAEKESALSEFGQKEGDVVIGHVQRFERGNLYIDLGRVTGIMPYEEQIPGERFRPGERIRALLVSVEETPRGIFLKLSRSHPDFLEKLFEVEAPELQNNTVEIKAIAREAGSRSKVAVFTNDDHIDPVGSLVGQRGVRVSTVMSELGGEKIDIIEWSEDSAEFIEDALSPAQVMKVEILEDAGSDDEDNRGHAVVEVAPDQQSLAIGRGGQNVRLAAKLTGWKIDIVSIGGDELAGAESDGDVTVAPDANPDEVVLEEEAAVTTKPEQAVSDDEETGDRDATHDDEIADDEDMPNTPERFEEKMAESEKEEKINNA